MNVYPEGVVILLCVAVVLLFTIVVLLIVKGSKCNCKKKTETREPVKLDPTCEQEVIDETIKQLLSKTEKEYSKYSSASRNEYSKVPTSRLKNEFKIIGTLGRGAYGTVYEAKNRFDGGNYAIKKIKIRRDDNVETVMREVKALVNASHSNIVQYHHSWIEASHVKERCFQSSTSEAEEEKDYYDVKNTCPHQYLYIQMQYCPNGTLRKWIKNRNESLKGTHLEEMDMINSKDIFGQIVIAVEYLHKMQFMHRDLTPYNIFMFRKTTVKVGDFGLAKFIPKEEGQSAEGLDLTHTAEVGSYLYRAPEQNDKSYDFKVDIFPLGIILFELLYPMKTMNETSRIIQNVRKMEFPTEFTPPELMGKMLAEDPKERPTASQTADDKLLQVFWELRQKNRHSSEEDDYVYCLDQSDSSIYFNSSRSSSL